MIFHYIGLEKVEVPCPHCGTQVVKKKVAYLDDDQNNSYAMVVKYCSICETVYEETNHGKVFIKNWMELD